MKKGNAIQCVFCEQIDEPGEHDSALCPGGRLAPVDTHPKGGDPSGAPFMGSAVPKAGAHI